MNILDLMAKAQKYYDNDDSSHGWGHICQVLYRAKYLKGSELDLVETAAIVFHDSSLKEGPRSSHEIDSAIIAARELFLEMDPSTIDVISDAIACHRASCTKPRTTYVANLLAAADRNPPDESMMLRRSYLYAIEHGMGPHEASEHALKHVREKYGPQGYAWENCPELYTKKYAGALELMWKRLETLTPEAVHALVVTR